MPPQVSGTYPSCRMVTLDPLNNNLSEKERGVFEGLRGFFVIKGQTGLCFDSSAKFIFSQKNLTVMVDYCCCEFRPL